MVLCGGFSAEVRAKKMRQNGGAEFISASPEKFVRFCGEREEKKERTANIYPIV
ncbi:hypothetical protein HMPREF9081_0916 [Centipeda periodontii DSM 2778]|uniref:Uncharacterized protein n=1 Tax=Centipeda periodontii DSM 2778 TaxID=888060 RepID=F5RKY1_9FIRM|nr:hypothetical protein HMPREF9081_0916 [Centipeda periodontii DSM 2778]